MKNVVRSFDRNIVLYSMIILCSFSKKKEPIRISALSPLNTVQSNYAECGVCEDKNAVCIRAATQTTCWCQAGYKKENNRCGMYTVYQHFY